MPAEIAQFSLWLDGWPDTLAEPDPVTAIESRLLFHIPNAVQLLRWAVVSVNQTRFLCEGAAILQHTPSHPV